MPFQIASPPQETAFFFSSFPVNVITLQWRGSPGPLGSIYYSNWATKSLIYAQWWHRIPGSSASLCTSCCLELTIGTSCCLESALAKRRQGEKTWQSRFFPPPTQSLLIFLSQPDSKRNLRCPNFGFWGTYVLHTGFSWFLSFPCFPWFPQMQLSTLLLVAVRVVFVIFVIFVIPVVFVKSTESQNIGLAKPRFKTLENC